MPKEAVWGLVTFLFPHSRTQLSPLQPGARLCTGGGEEEGGSSRAGWWGGGGGFLEAIAQNAASALRSRGAHSICCSVESQAQDATGLATPGKGEGRLGAEGNSKVSCGGRCCQLAQWAAGFSRDEDVLVLVRLGWWQRPAPSSGPRCSRDVGCAEAPWGRAPCVTWVGRLGLQVLSLARLPFLV